MVLVRGAGVRHCDPLSDLGRWRSPPVPLHYGSPGSGTQVNLAGGGTYVRSPPNRRDPRRPPPAIIGDAIADGDEVARPPPRRGVGLPRPPDDYPRRLPRRPRQRGRFTRARWCSVVPRGGRAGTTGEGVGGASETEGKGGYRRNWPWWHFCNSFVVSTGGRGFVWFCGVLGVPCFVGWGCEEVESWLWCGYSGGVGEC